MCLGPCLLQVTAFLRPRNTDLGLSMCFLPPPLPLLPYLIKLESHTPPFPGVDTQLRTRGAVGMQSAAKGAGRRAAWAAGCRAWGGGGWRRRQVVSGQIPDKPAWRLPEGVTASP